MPLAAQLAVCDRFGVADMVLDWFDGVQIREDRFQVAIVEVFVNHDRHDRTEFLPVDFSAAQYVEKERFVVINDAGGIRSEVGAGDVAPWAY